MMRDLYFYILEANKASRSLSQINNVQTCTSGSGEGQVMDFCGHASINGRVQYFITNRVC